MAPDLGQARTLYTLDVGPRWAWLAGREDEEDRAWTLDARADHRSEHVSNPPVRTGTDGPETAFIEFGTPGWAHRSLNAFQEAFRWFDFVQASARLGTFVFESETRFPDRANEDWIVHLGLRLWSPEFWKSQVYAEGRRAFFGIAPTTWKSELGWQRSNLNLFYRAESLKLGHSPEFVNRVEHFAGIRVFFLN